MSGEIPQTLREQADALIDAINARDFDAIAQMPWLDPEFEFRSVLSAVEGQFHVGTSGLRDWAESMDSVWSDFRVQIRDFRELEDGRVLVTFQVTGQARGSELPLDAQTAQVWTFRNGKLWHNQSYADPDQARQAVGLSE